MARVGSRLTAGRGYWVAAAAAVLAYAGYSLVVAVLDADARQFWIAIAVAMFALALNIVAVLDDNASSHASSPSPPVSKRGRGSMLLSVVVIGLVAAIVARRMR